MRHGIFPVFVVGQLSPVYLVFNCANRNYGKLGTFFDIIFREDPNFSEITTAKWIFDVEIEKVRAKVLFTWEEDKILAWLFPLSTNRAFKSKF